MIAIDNEVEALDGFLTTASSFSGVFLIRHAAEHHAGDADAAPRLPAEESASKNGRVISAVP